MQGSTDEYAYAPKEVHNQNHENRKYESNEFYDDTKYQMLPQLHSLHGYKTDHQNFRNALAKTTKQDGKEKTDHNNYKSKYFGLVEDS